MRKLVGLSVVVVLVMVSNDVVAQNAGLFSGNGIKDGWGSSSSPDKLNSSSVFGFHQGTRANEATNSGFKFPKFELPKIKSPKWELPKFLKSREYAKPIQFSDSAKSGLFSGFPKLDLMSKQNSGQLNFFQRMNERTKQIFGQTRDGISNLSVNPFGKEKQSAGTWDSITKGMTAPSRGSGNRNQPPLQPNLRSARQAEGSASRF